MARNRPIKTSVSSSGHSDHDGSLSTVSTLSTLSTVSTVSPPGLVSSLGLHNELNALISPGGERRKRRRRRGLDERSLEMSDLVFLWVRTVVSPGHDLQQGQVTSLQPHERISVRSSEMKIL